MLLGERDTGKEICDVQGASAANAASHQARLLLFKAFDGLAQDRAHIKGDVVSKMLNR